MKDKEIFYFDVDGTILDKQSHTIGEKTIEALNLLKDKGYKVAMCTGRTIGAIKNTQMKDIVEWDGYVLTNGSTILNKDFEVVFDNLFEPQFIEELISIYPSSILLESDELYLINDISDNMKDFLTAHEITLPKQINYNGLRVPKVTIDDVTLIDQGLKNPVFTNSTFERNSAGMYEFTLSGGGKHNGMKRLNDYLNTKKSVFFGDGINDIDALKYADVGVAMGNAVTEAKDVADFVTTSVSEDGIYHALKHFKVI